jgi:hypothetical protein
VVTTGEIGAVPVFAALDEAERERLSRAAADITLAAGEYAVHQGEPSAHAAAREGLAGHDPAATTPGLAKGLLRHAD